MRNSSPPPQTYRPKNQEVCNKRSYLNAILFIFLISTDSAILMCDDIRVLNCPRAAYEGNYTEKKNNGDRQEGQLYIETAFPLVNCSVLTSLKEGEKKGELCLLNKEQLKGTAFPK